MAVNEGSTAGGPSVRSETRSRFRIHSAEQFATSGIFRTKEIDQLLAFLHPIINVHLAQDYLIYPSLLRHWI